MIQHITKTNPGAVIAHFTPKSQASYRLAGLTMIVALREAALELIQARRFDAAEAVAGSIHAAVDRLGDGSSNQERVSFVARGYDAVREIQTEARRTERAMLRNDVLGGCPTGDDLRTATRNLGVDGGLRLTVLEIDGDRRTIDCLSEIDTLESVVAFLGWSTGTDLTAYVSAAILHAWAVTRLWDGEAIDIDEVRAWRDEIPALKALSDASAEQALADAEEVYQEQRIAADELERSDAAQMQSRV